ncbi:hypothetical protein CPB83DRAFT_762351 [Crepidotus variabilis]|uniref:RRM domain-containing protein n=1 Tax=Crepidotus variabilis TaxID=179855 RepID=A0A9P6EKW0_9AGAR|nr:hypothetical protein CPB83DRAFT_762351 [Crepidotus variabilis]
MEEGTRAKKTVFVGGISDDTDETTLYEGFSVFGDIIEVQIPPPPNQNPNQVPNPNDPKHRGFAFVTFSSSADAQDAMDNMDMNELKGRVLKVNLARPMKAAALNPQPGRAIWESEEWLKENVKPLAQAGGKSLHSIFQSSSQF